MPSMRRADDFSGLLQRDVYFAHVLYAVLSPPGAAGLGLPEVRPGQRAVAAELLVPSDAGADVLKLFDINKLEMRRGLEPRPID